MSHGRILRGALICAMLVAFAAPFASASIWYVDADAIAPGDGLSWVTAYADLQDALAAAQAGDEIWVAEGTYKPGDGSNRNATFLLVSGVGLYGGFDGTEALRDDRDWDTHVTILSGAVGEPDSSPYGILDDLHVLAAENVGADTTVDGFTLTHGATRSLEPSGAGLRISGGSPRIRNCRIVENIAAYRSAGVFIGDAATPEFENVVIANNRAGHSYGGVECSLDARPIFRGVDFVNNYSPFGVGGVRATGTFVDCNFLDNECDEGPSALAGSGTFVRVRFAGNRASGHVDAISCTMLGGGTLSDVIFEDNVASGPRGVGGLEGGGSLTNVIFRNNQAACSGARLANESTLRNVLALGSKFASAAIWVGVNAPNAYTTEPEPSFSGPVRLIQCTLVGGSTANGYGPALRTNGHDVIVENSIMLGSVGPDTYFPAAYFEDVNFSTVTFSNSIALGSGGSGGGWDPAYGMDGGGNIDLPPLFADVTNGDFALLAGSPGVDSGDDVRVPPDLLYDLAGNPRVFGSHVDMGAYELQAPNCGDFAIEFGASWDGVSLQSILNDEYGVGVIDATNDYEGARCGDAVVPYWVDDQVHGWIVREIAGNANENEFGWYVEDFIAPVIDGIGDGVIFTGAEAAGASALVDLPGGVSRFGFFLNPNGASDAANAPEPEHFFTNRFLNDVGPDGGGSVHAPDGGDAQCLIYNITALRGGVPTFVLAWEDLDSGATITPQYDPSTTDNDYQDLVLEIQAASPVPAAVVTLQGRAMDEGVELQWQLANVSPQSSLELRRSFGATGRDLQVAYWPENAEASGRWLDADLPADGIYEYVAIVRDGDFAIRSETIRVQAKAPQRLATQLLRAVPNPFNPQTRLDYTLERAGEVTLRIYDVAGRQVRNLSLGQQPAGPGSVTWNGQDDDGSAVASGVYVVRLTAGGEVRELRVGLVK